MTEVRKVSQIVSFADVEAKAEQLGVTVEDFIDDPFKAHYGVSVEELFSGSTCSL